MHRITVQYDGTDYHGWQMQTGQRTIQGELTRALSLLNRATVTIHGAGRTDAGVHALGQVASFRIDVPFEPEDLMAAINGNLDPDIRVTECSVVPESFHARHSATSKSYRYRIWRRRVVSPFARRYVYHRSEALDLRAMRAAAALLPGTRDFSAFTVKDAEVQSKIRTLTRLDVEERDEEIWITAEADGFLRFMVRTIVGALIEVGRGQMSPPELARVVELGERENAGATAPAHGLTLMRVDY
ncbi:MAG TPA: tRNA pseudouridine(38-40) synthase TruA [Blastocatellia bacterium]|nr:tRNA pseudouridine(38-40) synthase TruA [Blastocatellia bacterium]